MALWDAVAPVEAGNPQVASGGMRPTAGECMRTSVESIVILESAGGRPTLQCFVQSGQPENNLTWRM